MKSPQKSNQKFSHRLTSSLGTAIGSVVAMLMGMACAPGGGGGNPASAPSPTNGGVVLQGTVSGGGGNGCDGKAFEAYAKKITDLSEYKLFIRPLLRKMSEESADPFVTYMLWVAEEKAWFFAPCELERLSSAQIGVNSETDQLARHTEHGIQIYAIEDEKNVNQAKTYYQKKSKAKAALLLHEMVMGARLLMKKSAKEQCMILARKDANVCANPEMMAIAESREIDPSQAGVMDAADHEAVRTMTSLLAQKDADLSTENLMVLRQRLGFHFPWDRALSSLTYDGLKDAFARTQQLGDQFRVAGTATEPLKNGGRSYQKPISHPYFENFPMTCSIALETNHSIGLQISVVTPWEIKNFDGEIKAFYERAGSMHNGQICIENASRIHQQYVWDPEKNTISNKPCKTATRLFSLYDYLAHFSIDSENFQARGVLRDGVLYDEVSITKNDNWTWLKFGSARTFKAGVVRILVTRDAAPRIRSLSFEPKQVLERNEAKTDTSRPAELLAVPNTLGLECVSESPGRP